MVMDDTPANVALMQKVLEVWGFKQVRCLMDPREFMTVFHEFRPQLLFLDFKMPFIDGLQILASMGLEEDAFSHTKVIMLSGDVDEETISLAQSLGAADYVTKPFTIDTLKQRVMRAIEG